jgi:intraflagellar transport protein 140
MKEAMKQLDKSGGTDKEQSLALMRKRVHIIEQFVQAREALTANDSEGAMRICDQLVNTPGVEEAIRLGDVFAQLIEHHFYK